MILIITALIPLILFFILTSPVLLVLWFVRKKDPIKASKVAQPIVKYAFRFIMCCAGTKTVRLGLENIPKDKAVMFAANHKSIMDASVGYGSVPVQTLFVAKKELRKVPFFSWWMDLCCCFFLDRKNPKSGLDMILYCIDMVKNKGVSVFISPEGTRSHTDEPLPFKAGTFKIATKSGCPIIPVAISGTDDIFENSKPFIKRATAVMEFGKPIYLEDLTEEERANIAEYTRDIIIKMLEGHEDYIKNNPSRKKLRKAAVSEVSENK